MNAWLAGGGLALVSLFAIWALVNGRRARKARGAEHDAELALVEKERERAKAIEERDEQREAAAAIADELEESRRRYRALTDHLKGEVDDLKRELQALGVTGAVRDRILRLRSTGRADDPAPGDGDPG